MEVQLTPDQDALIRVGIQTGRFQRPEDAVEEALSLWEARERARIDIIEALNEAEASRAANGQGP